jgi:signal transduction histidine kinase
MSRARVAVPTRIADPPSATRRRLIEAADAARRGVARDLHDGAQQQMVVCLSQLQRAQHKWDSDASRARELLDAGVRAAEAALLSLRELAAGVHPAILTHLGLGAAVEELAFSVPLPVALDLTDDRFQAPFEASVYFFVSEALSNVVKHAQADHVSIRIGLEGDLVIIEVADDGVGGARATCDGSGLPGLADRVAAFDGSLSITSASGAGTILRADVPRPAPAAT